MTSMPCSRMNSGAPGKLRLSPTTTFLNPKLHRRAGAEVAGHQRGVEGAAAVRAEPAGIAEAIGLAVRDRIAILHALIMAGGDELAVFDQRRADRDATLGQALQGVSERGGHENV